MKKKKKKHIYSHINIHTRTYIFMHINITEANDTPPP